MAAKESKTRAASTKKAAPAESAATAKASTAAKKPATRRAPAKKKAPEITDEMVAERAYYLSISGEGSDDHMANWLQAEAELRG
jgi:hypothetical protein